MIYVTLVFLVIAGIVAISSNSDVFSPAKIYLLLFAVFHSGALFSDLNLLAEIMIFFVLAVGFLIAFAEGQMVQALPPMRKRWRFTDPDTTPDFTRAIWLLSMPSLLAQLFMIQQFGGITGYIDSLGTRVVDWAGFGWARTLINLFTPFNLVYLALGLQTQRDRRWWLLYSVHFLIVLLLGVLSGSRSGVLSVFAIQLMIFHYLRSPVKGQAAGALAGSLLVAAFVLGVLRNGVKFQDGGLVFGSFSTQTGASLSSFNSGVDAIKVISEAPFMPLAHGSTFFSILTNPVPRAIWPDKPDPGGVFFTKNYTGDAWLGLSNLSPTFLGEFLINFGWAGGVVGFALVYPLILLWVIRLYRARRLALQQWLTPLIAVDTVLYLSIAWAMVALMVGEATNVIVNLVLSQLVPIFMVRSYVAWVERRRATRAMPLPAVRLRASST